MEHTAKGGVEMKQALFIAAIAALWIAPWFLAGLNLWGWFWVCVVVLVIAFEIIAVVITKHKIGKSRTLSQMFWDYSKDHKWQAWAIVASITVRWIALILHLVGKRLL